MTEIIPQIYDLSGDCNKMLPVGGIVNSLTFQEVTILEHEIDSSEWLLPDLPTSEQLESLLDHQSLTIGIPLSVISPAYDRMAQPRIVRTANGKSIVAGKDRTFLPSYDGKLIPAVNPQQRVVVDSQDLKSGTTNILGQEVEITARTIELLETYGEAFARLTKEPGSLHIHAKYKNVVVDGVNDLLTNRVIKYKGQQRNVLLTNVAKMRLSRGEPALVRLDGGKLLMVAVKKPSLVPQPNNNLYSLRANNQALSDAEQEVIDRFETFLLQKYQNKCDLIVALHADPRAREFYDSSLSPDPNLPQIIDEIFYPLLQSLHKKLEWTNCFDQGDDLQADPYSAKPAPQPKFPVYEIGLVTAYKQDWKLEGYTRGSLLSSITLAPREEIQIEVFTWDRHKLEEEQTFSTEYEKNLEFNVLNRGSSEVGRTINEEMGAQAGGRVGGSLPIKKAEVRGEVGGQVAQQLQTERQLTVGRLNEATTKASERFKASHKVKIVQTHEYGAENRTTRRFSNANLGRTLTLHHFEILEHFKVTTAIQESANPFCLLVENPPLGEGEEFEMDFILQFEDRLQQALLSPNFKAGFDASRMLAAQRWYEETTAQEEIAPVTPAGDADEGTDAHTVPVKGIFATAQNLVDTLAIFLEPGNDQYIEPLDRVFDRVIEHLTQGSATAADMINVDRALTRHAFWFRMTFSYPGFEASAKKFMREVKQEFANSGPESKDKIAAAVSLLVGGLDDDWLFTLKSIALPIIFSRMLELVNPIYGAVLTTYLYKNVLTPDDMGLSALLSKARKQAKDYDDVQEAETLMPDIPNPFAGNGNNVLNITSSPLVERAPRVYSAKELAEAHADFLKLKLHLKANSDYYRNELWRREDPAERYLRLDKEGLTPFIENRLLGFAGNKAMYPLRLPALPQATQRELKLMAFGDQQNGAHADNGDNAQPFIQNVILPTPGLHMEAILGQCEALEPFLIEMRELEKQERIANVLLLEEELAQERMETERLLLRLQQDPPLLDDPYAAEAEKSVN